MGKAYADASVSIHFLFISKPAEQIFGTVWRRNPTISRGLQRDGKGEGRIRGQLGQSLSWFRQSVEASETYSLLYYFPKDYKIDGKFRNIEVKVKD